ncbi:MAG: lipoate--protein ligase family protein [Gemmataceae bacterium]
MNAVDCTLPTPEENLALDEALLLTAEERPGTGEVLRFWELPTQAVVLGSGGIVADDVQIAACEAAGIPIRRRSSGGGTVLLGPGCLCYSLVLAYERHPALGEIGRSYRWILDKVIEGLGVPGLAVQGICDLTWGDRKCSGNAQQRKRYHLLHHGTLLYRFDLSCVTSFLTLPPRRPDYRADRPHEDFVCNLPLSRAELIARVTAAWDVVLTQRFVLPLERVADLVATKYARVEWNRRR